MAIGVDVGTSWIVSAKQVPDENDDKEEVIFKRMRDAFFKLEVNQISEKINIDMLTKFGADWIQPGGKGTPIYVLGEHAINYASMFSQNVRRPMATGVINFSGDPDAVVILVELMNTLVGKADKKDEPLRFSIPAPPIDSQYNVDSHKLRFQQIFSGLGYDAKGIAEAVAVGYAELEDFTGWVTSWGGGNINAALMIGGTEVVTMAIASSGDWIDNKVAVNQGYKTTTDVIVRKEHEGFDLSSPKDNLDYEIVAQYMNRIEYAILNFSNALKKADVVVRDPLPWIVAGGTASVKGFRNILTDMIDRLGFHIPISEVRMAKNMLNATAKGCLMAAQIEEG